MPRQSITFTPPNDSWLKEQADSGEFLSKSDVVNDLIRKARRENAELEWIRTALIEGEKSGTSQRTPKQIRESVKQKLIDNGKL